MNIILCDNSNHPVYKSLSNWLKDETENISLISKASELPEKGNLLFMVSCSQIIGDNIRERFEACLVLHASDLPQNRGWSPHIWEILEGKNTLTLSLLEACEPVDTGDIWRKMTIPLGGHELYDEINERLFSAEKKLIKWAIKNQANCVPQTQTGATSYRPKRTPKNSEIDVSKSIEEQFDLIRVCDTDRFPAFFTHRGHKYIIKLEKADG